MKRIVTMVSAAVFLLSALPAFSATTTAGKDECLLESKNCSSQVDDIYKRIHKLDKEIKKGKKVYSPEELKKLETKLKETQDVLDQLEMGGGN